MTIDRRLHSRDADSSASRWLWKLVGLAILATIAVCLLLKYTQVIR
jgi:hypothetical protein